MIKRSAIALLLALAACGDNSLPELPPEFSSSNITMTVKENDTLEIDAMATDPVGRPLNYSATTPEHGTLSGTAPQYMYAPDPDFVGSDTFTITVSNGVESIAIPVFITVELVETIQAEP